MEKKYSVVGNFRYAMVRLKRTQGRHAYVICTADVILSALFPFLGMVLPSVVVVLLVSGRTPAQILLLLTGYLILFQGIRVLQTWASGRKFDELFLFRLKVGEEYMRKCLDAEAQFWETTEGQKKAEAARQNLFDGNDTGIEAFLRAFLTVPINLLGMAVYAVIIGRWNLWFLLLTAVLAVIVAAADMLAERHAYRLEQAKPGFWTYYYEKQYLKQESILPKNGKDIRLYRLKAFFLDALHHNAEKLTALKTKEWHGYTAASVVEKALAFLRDILVYGYLIYQMMQGIISVDVFLLYLGATAGFGMWMSDLFEGVQKIMQNNKFMNKYRDFMDSGIVEAEGKKMPARQGKLHEIRLEHVSFRYEGQDEDTIHDISLTIHPGEKLALVGVNGAGKTTLIKLLCGLYHPTSGKICLDGQDVSSLNQLEYFKEFTVVFQNVFAFSFSMEDNVSCTEQDSLDIQKLQACLQKADLWDKVQSLPERSKTMMNKDLDENGVSLSGGELQKLMLARALYKDAPVVVLDEPTAALDPIAESEMYERYHEMMAGKTAVFISHRLSSTRFCDRILFMENGRITEEGSHEELMEKQGAYSEMFKVQAQYYQKQEQEEASYA